MYGIFTYIWLISMVKVGRYNIYGWYWICNQFYNHIIHVMVFFDEKFEKKCIIPDICSKWNPNFFGGKECIIGKTTFLCPFGWYLNDLSLSPKNISPKHCRKKQCMSKKKNCFGGWWPKSATFCPMKIDLFLMALVVSTHLKNVHQWGTGNLLQIGVNMKNVWNHNLDHTMQDCNEVWSQDESWVQ